MEDIDLNEALKEAVGSVTPSEPAGKDGAEDTPSKEVSEVTETAEAATETVAEAEAGKGDGDGKPSAYSPDDATVERAVKAGLSLADVRALPNAEVAERIIAALESKAPKEEHNDEQKTDDGDDLSAILEEYTEENGYEPGVVKAMTTLAKKVQRLESAGRSAEKADFFNSQFAALDEAVRSHVDAVRKSQLKSKFDMLEAGYKATKANVRREDVFKEAVSLAFGDLVQKAAEAGKAAALEKRKTLAIARPGGERGIGKAGSGAPMSDDDIVNTLFAALSK